MVEFPNYNELESYRHRLAARQLHASFRVGLACAHIGVCQYPPFDRKRIFYAGNGGMAEGREGWLRHHSASPRAFNVDKENAEETGQGTLRGT